jgi:hypothetical protein
MKNNELRILGELAYHKQISVIRPAERGTAIGA